MKTLLISKDLRKQLRIKTPGLRKALTEKIRSIAQDSEAYEHYPCVASTGRKVRYARLYFHKQRLIFQVNDDEVKFYMAGHRGNVYDEFHERIDRKRNWGFEPLELAIV